MSTERNWDERPYDDIRDMKRQLDKLTGSIGDMRDDIGKMVTVLKGDEYGSEGLVMRVMAMEEEQRKLTARLDIMERHSKLNRRYLMAFVGTAGTVIGTVMKIIIDHLVPVKR